MDNIVKNLRDYSSFRMGGRPLGFSTVTSRVELARYMSEATLRGLPVWILGSGTNTVFNNKLVPYYIIHMQVRGREVVFENKDCIRIRVGAGEVWDEFVAYAVAEGLSGVEFLSGIPGTVGAAPVQNIGAYGSEVAHVLYTVEVFDIKKRTFRLLPPEQCHFGYRTSIFKTTARNSYVITAVTFELQKNRVLSINNSEIKKELAYHAAPTLMDIRTAVLAIRGRKLPDYTCIPNVGSFFQNPIINEETKTTLLQQHPNAPVFKTPDNSYKVSAGWLLEQAGYKGRRVGHFQFSPQHALVLTHTGEGSMEELKQFMYIVTIDIETRFGVSLGVEPELVY